MEENVATWGLFHFLAERQPFDERSHAEELRFMLEGRQVHIVEVHLVRPQVVENSTEEIRIAVDENLQTSLR